MMHIVVHGFMHKSSRSANASRHLSLHMTQACHKSPFVRLLVVSLPPISSSLFGISLSQRVLSSSLVVYINMLKDFCWNIIFAHRDIISLMMSRRMNFLRRNVYPPLLVTELLINLKHNEHHPLIATAHDWSILPQRNAP